jgi:hypothetical protein
MGSEAQAGGLAARTAIAVAALAVTLVLALAGRAEAMLYWGRGDQIERMNFDGTYRSNVPDLSRFYPGIYVRADGQVCGVAVDATHVYWGNRSSGTIGRANLDGSEPNDAFVVGAEEPCGVAVDASHLYWANLGGHTLGRANLDGSGVDQAFVETGSRPCGVAVNGSNVFWGRGSGDALGRADLDGGDVVPDFIATTAGVCGVAVDATRIYWANFLGSIGRAYLSGASQEPDFITGLDRPGSVAVDGAHVFWDEESIEPGTIGEANLDGSGVNRVVTGLASPGGIAVDSRYYVPSPLPASRIRLGRLRRNERKGVAFLAVEVPDSGQFRVKLTNGLDWRFVGAGVGPALAGGGRRWLRIWPSGGGWDGHNARRQLRNRGRLRVRVSVEYTEIERAPTTRARSLTLIREPSGRGNSGRAAPGAVRQPR